MGKRSILIRTVTADRGMVQVPMLAPHLKFRVIEQGQVLITSETFNTLINGSIYPSLLPLLDGKRTCSDIAAALQAGFMAFQVEAAITGLASRGYVVSGEHDMDSGSAAFWCSLGASPVWAEDRLRAARVRVLGTDHGFTRHLVGMGVSVVDDSPDLVVAVCDDYLDEQNAALNRQHLASGVPWTVLVPKGMWPLVGPVFRPGGGGSSPHSNGGGGPCWHCLAYRLRGHQEVHNFLRNVDGDAAATVQPAVAAPVALNAFCGFAAVEIAKWLVLHDLAPLHNRAISFDVARVESKHHTVMRRPQCSSCGDTALYRPDREPVPVRLQSSPKTVRNSGGLRSVSPAETIRNYRHLVSPVSGVVTWLRRDTNETDSWLHVYSSGNNFALRNRSLNSLRKSLRAKSAGKGSTPQQSEASALCEAVERYCLAAHGEEICRHASFADWERRGAAEAVHPNDVQLFSERQLDHAEAINACGHPLNHVPPRLDPEQKIDWTPVWSFTQQRHRYLPLGILYAIPAECRTAIDLKSDTNGCAAGNTLEEAIVQGFYELVERDAFAIWWYNRLQLPGVDLHSFNDHYLASAAEHYRRFNREVWVLDATSDFSIPVFVAVSRRVDQEQEDIIYGAGAHADPHIAALRALCEVNQFLSYVHIAGPSDLAVVDPLCTHWWEKAKLADNAWLAPAACPMRGPSHYPVPATTDLKEDVERCQALVEAKGMEFLALDYTRPDIGMPVARVIVPGMRHFWERFAPGRLYDVPVQMGWRERQLEEAELNPAPVTI